MRRAASIIIVLLALSAAGLADEPLAKLKQKADTGSASDCAKECMKYAERLVEEADKQFTAGTVDQGQKTMAEAVQYAQKGTKASIQSRKHQKHTEISLRKMAKRMTDIAQSLELDDRAPVQQGEKQIEKLRDELLSAMFGNPKKSLEDK